MDELTFDEKLQVYREFHKDELGRGQAKLLIGTDWEVVSQIASAEIAYEEHNPLSSAELDELLS